MEQLHGNMYCTHICLIEERTHATFKLQEEVNQILLSLNSFETMARMKVFSEVLYNYKECCLTEVKV